MFKINITKFLLFFILFISLQILGCSQLNTSGSFPRLTGPYLGQTPPGDTPELFAPGIVTTGLFTRDVAMTPDGNEIYFCIALGNYAYSTIMVTRQENGRWTEPCVVPHMDTPEYMNFEPCISSDGNKFYFLTNRPDTASGETQGNQDIWVMDRTPDGWGKPYDLGPPVNTEHAEYFPSVTRDGTMYFTRSLRGERTNYIYRARLKDGKYEEPEKLPPQVNSGPSQFNAFIAPDESYLIIPIFGREDSFGSTDYYICFRSSDDTWSEPVNMGEKINTPGGLEFSPYVSPDGKYFFFMRTNPPRDNNLFRGTLTLHDLMRLNNQPQNGNSDIYWVDTSFIQELKSE
jgi:hypothetical protein